MTKDEFFQNITSRGVLSTLQTLAGQSPEGELQMKRLEGLSKDLKLGLVTLANAAIQRNRIAMGILSLLEDEEPHESHEAEAQSSLSEILREYLEVSELEESASKAQAQAEHDKVVFYRKKYFHELPEPDLSPVPKTSLASLEDIRNMLASSQLELALRHALTLAQGTDFFEKVEKLGEQYKQLFRSRRLQVISHEEAGMEENRITRILIQELEKFAQVPGRKETSFWNHIRKWLK